MVVIVSVVGDVSNKRGVGKMGWIIRWGMWGARRCKLVICSGLGR